MVDTLELFRPLCNGSVRVESRTEKLTGDTGFLLLREALYRRRGKAEAHMGEFKNVIGSSLPCTSRGAALDATVLARSQALMSLRLLAYQLLHVLRTEMEAVTWQGWSLRRLRERVLKAGACPLTHARRITVVIERRAADLWRRLLRRWKHRPPLPT